MLNHSQVWTAIDQLAARYGMTPSGLAKKAGLDPTTFNKSKRKSPDGRLRWPSTESIAKILDATGAGIDLFMSLLGPGAPAHRRPLPLIGLAQAGDGGFFDDGGFPVGGSWDEVGLPEVADPHAYALEISGDSMEPVYRDGDIVIVSPAAPLRRGDRVVARTHTGEVMAKELARRSARRIELKSLNPNYPNYAFDLNEVVWMHRIVWASQ